jgi:hypothetical protein
MVHKIDLYCAWCGKLNDRHESTTNPKAHMHKGDISLCISCGEWNVFTGRRLRIPTDVDLEEIASNPLCRRVREAWVEMMDEERRNEEIH